MRTTPDTQIVFLDTPGVHKPRTLLGERANDRALTTLAEVDVVCFLIEANAPIGPGDRFVAARLAEVRTPVVLAVNKVDLASRDQILDHLAEASGELGDFAAYVPLSAREGEGVDALLGELELRLPPGPHYYPEGVVSDQPESFLAAELLREQLLAMAREELPHSIAVTADEIEERETADGPLLAIRVVVRVERDSQKGIVIGRGGSGLEGRRHRCPARVGGPARHARPPGDQGEGRSRLATAGRFARSSRALSTRSGRARRSLVIMRVPPRRAVGVPELSFGESTAVESGRSPAESVAERG